MSEKLQLTMAVINSAPTTKEVLELPAVADNWIRTFNKVSGKQDGAMRYEAEKILFMRAVANNKALDKCEKFSLFAAFIELAISGLTLRDGLTYIIPYGKTASFMVGWKGRLEQITEIPTVVHCHEPQVVFDCDDFDYEKGQKVRINKHKPGNRTNENFITHVYFVIEFTYGPVVYIMDRGEVLNIRDNYSASFKMYLRDYNAMKATNPDLQFGQTWKMQKTGQHGTYEVEVELPMWLSDEIQAFKKTIVRRVYGMQEKTPKLKYLDANIQQAETAGVPDPDEAKAETPAALKQEDFAAFSVVPPGNEPAKQPAGVTPAVQQQVNGAEPVEGGVFDNPNDGF